MKTPSVQTLTATTALAQYLRPIGVSIIPDGQDWSSRQQIQYEAMKGLMKDDFHGLADFNEQMNLYSSTNIQILKPAYTAMKPLIKINRNILQKLIYNPILGMWVGKLLMKVVGFEKAFTVPQDILEDNVALKARLS
jgi:hypothetical protein